MPELTNKPYSKREIDNFHQNIDSKLDDIIVQTTKHNSRLKKLETALLVVGTVVGVLLITNGSELISFLSLII